MYLNKSTVTTVFSTAGNLAQTVAMATLKVTTKKTSNVSLLSWLPMVFFILFIFVFNSLIIIAFLRNHQIRQSSTNCLVLNLALIDFFVGVLYIPLVCASKYKKDADLNLFLFSMDIYLTTTTLVLAAADRLQLLRGFPMKIEKTRRLVAAAWLISSLLTMVHLAVYYSRDSLAAKEREIRQYNLYLSIMFLIVLPIVFFTVCYTYHKNRLSIFDKREMIKTVRNIDDIITSLDDIQALSRSVLITRVVLMYTVCFGMTFALKAIVNTQLTSIRSSKMSTTGQYLYLLRCVLSPIIALTEKDYGTSVYNFLGGL